MTALTRISELITKTLDISEILRKVAEITAEIMKVDVCSLYLYDSKENVLVLESTVGLNSDAIGNVRIHQGEGITGRAAKQCRIVAVNDVSRDKRNLYFPITGEEDYLSLLSVPLVFHDELIGVLNVQTKKPRVFQKHERRLLKNISLQISGAIRNARLYKSVVAAKLELEQTQELLVQSEKMAAMGRLAATLSHELRNPLAGLKGASQLLLRKTDEKDDRYSYVTLIIEEVNRLGRIVEDLLNFYKPRELRFETIDSNQIIEKSILMISNEITSKNISIHKRLSKLPQIWADPDKFKQVVLNILLNSIEAMPDGGELTVSSGVIRDQNNRDISTFQFKDTGDGILEEVLAHIFEPFYTTKATGVGLGLPICKSIIEEHSGKIFISSNTGDSSSGTTVTIELPIYEQIKKQ